MKVAQYEVLGNIQKKETRPERDARRVLALRKPRSRDPSRNFLPSLAGRTFLLYRYPALRTGLLSFDSSRTIPSGVFCPSTDPPSQIVLPSMGCKVLLKKIQWQEDGEP